MTTPKSYAAFQGPRRIAAGGLKDVLLATKALQDAGDDTLVLLFEDDTGRQVDFDLRGTPDEVLARALPPTGPGRPKLGVQAREVTLLPRHWAWLEAQPSGSSAALRRLVEAALKDSPQADTARRAVDATGRVMTALAGDLPGFEEASRALWAWDDQAFAARIKRWPKDVRAHLQHLLGGALRNGKPARGAKPAPA